MNFLFSVSACSLGLFAGMLILLELGRRLGAKALARDTEGANAGIGAIEAAVFGLLGLLIAFTFSGAGSRLDARRQLIIEETNAIGTAYLRLDVLPASVQPALKEEFRRYVDARLQFYRKLPDTVAAKEEQTLTNRLQDNIWRQAVASSRMEGAHPSAAMLLLPALNEMIDIVTTRAMAMQIHPPTAVYLMLFALSLTGSLLAGYGMAPGKFRNWIHMLAFALVLAISVYVILDMEYPRRGLIRVDAFDQALVKLRESIK